MPVTKNSKIKLSIFEYRKILNGKIRFTSQKRQEFKGFISLNKDPKGEDVGVENMIYRGSIVKYSEWVYAMVIYTGENCKVCQQSKFTKKPNLSRKIHLVSNQIFLIDILFTVFFSIVSL